VIFVIGIRTWAEMLAVPYPVRVKQAGGSMLHRWRTLADTVRLAVAVAVAVANWL
jgi:hypothetical protein